MSATGACRLGPPCQICADEKVSEHDAAGPALEGLSWGGNALSNPTRDALF